MEQQHDNENPEKNNELENQEIAEELETVSEARQNQKAGLDDKETALEQENVSIEDRLKEQHDEMNNKYLRLYAEFDNYKRRTSKERVDLLQSAGRDVISDLLTVVDDFDRAQKAISNTNDVDAIKEGINLVHQKLESILSKKGLKEMVSIGADFDPELHESITKIPAPNEHMVGKVIDEVEKGYFLNDKVLRYAKVVVGS